ncbi:hypothetical protein GGF32_009057 [Allomyces javanicus]|nr:hypothetical protein GGF32_009057 [Allomyces javanicus]
MDFKVERTKIYTTRDAGIAAALRSRSSAGHHGGNGNNPAAGAGHAHAGGPAASDLTESALAHELDRVKGLLKEREIKLLKVKEENAVLKQIERRHQRELAELEERNEDAPRVIRGFREEVQGLKNKLKDSYAFQGTQDRRIRLLAEQLDQAKTRNAEFEAIVTQQDLRVRAELQSEIDDVKRNISEKETICHEVNRRCELMEKNFLTESRNLRMKIQALEHENILFKDKIEALESTVRERDKEIASLSIYKYNALHRKPEPCKLCRKRQFEEREAQRRQAILAGMPRLLKPEATVVSATGISVSIDLPPVTSTCNYDRAVLECSLQPDFGEVEEFELSPGEHASVPVMHLPVGQYCYLRVAASYQEFAADPSEPEVVLVDVLPNPPPAPDVSFQLNSPSITVKMNEALEPSGGTPVHTFRLYHSTNGTDFFLHKELTADHDPSTPAAASESVTSTASELSSTKRTTFTDTSPAIAVSHWYAVSAVNHLGESPRSPAAGPVILDFAPTRPDAPAVRRHGSHSVQVSLMPPPSRGESDVLRYQIAYHPVGQSDEGTVFEVSARSLGPNGAGSVVIEELQLGEAYVFAVAVGNAVGWSDLSAYSHEVQLENMLPVPPSPQCIILSPNLVRCLLYAANEHEQCPPHTGYKLWIAQTHTLADNAVYCPFVPAQPNMPSECMLESLEPGGNYWISVSLVGVGQESALSAPVWVCLASAIPLPQTPAPPSRPSTAARPPPAARSTPPPTTLNRASSRSIDLTVAQRINNLFRGNPAFAVPDDVKAQAEADGIQVIVNNGYTSPTSFYRRASVEAPPPPGASGSRKDLATVHPSGSVVLGTSTGGLAHAGSLHGAPTGILGGGFEAAMAASGPNGSGNGGRLGGGLHPPGSGGDRRRMSNVALAPGSKRGGNIGKRAASRSNLAQMH